MRALIDADIIVYRCGFAGQKKGDDKKIEMVLHNVKSTINTILDATDAWDWELYLTGPGNFREEVAVTHKYKGNRDNLTKPHFYNEIKEYLIERWGAILIEGYEADDALAIAQMEDYQTHADWNGDSPSIFSDCKTVICSLDKDLDMVPGWHYNWVKDGMYWVSEEEGIRWFYKQLLMGDDTDNIKGIKGLGIKTADKLIDACETEEEMCCVAGFEYSKVFDDPEARLLENARLLWMQRSLGELWEMPNGTKEKDERISIPV